MVTTYYLDTSVAVHALNGGESVESWFDSIATSAEDVLVPSRLLQTELTRVLRRDGLPVRRREPILQSVGMSPVTEWLLTTAEAMTVDMKTLGAIHLATALAFGSDVVVATHDAALKTAVEAAGLQWIDPVVP